MANNPVLYNAIISACLGGNQQRPIVNANTSVYESFEDAVVVFATALDAIIPTQLPTPSQSDAQLIQSLVQGVQADRLLTSLDAAVYEDQLDAIAAVYEMFRATLEPVPSGGGTNTDEIANESLVPGATCTDALNYLLETDETIIATIAALDTDDIANTSTATGATCTAALNSLDEDIEAIINIFDNLNTSQVANVSDVLGATATIAFNTLLGNDNNLQNEINAITLRINALAAPMNKTFYVDASKADDGTGSIISPRNELQLGVNQAALVGDGQVFVAPGDYSGEGIIEITGGVEITALAGLFVNPEAGAGNPPVDILEISVNSASVFELQGVACPAFSPNSGALHPTLIAQDCYLETIVAGVVELTNCTIVDLGSAPSIVQDTVGGSVTCRNCRLTDTTITASGDSVTLIGCTVENGFAVEFDPGGTLYVDDFTFAQLRGIGFFNPDGGTTELIVLTGSDNVVNQSDDVSGSNVSNALDTLAALIDFATNLASAGFKKVVMRIFLASATYTPSTGMVQVLACLIAGGGGGGGAKTDGNGHISVGGAGAASGFTAKLFTAADIGASKAVVIGAAGVGGPAAATSDGTNGTNSTLGGTMLVCPGADGGFSVINNLATVTIGGKIGSVPATAGALCIPGGNGGQGNGVCTATQCWTDSGRGGNSLLGGGGIERKLAQNDTTTDTGSNGSNGTGYGSGGGGAAVMCDGTGRIGGDGGPGIGIFFEYCDEV